MVASENNGRTRRGAASRSVFQLPPSRRKSLPPWLVIVAASLLGAGSLTWSVLQWERIDEQVRRDLLDPSLPVQTRANALVALQRSTLRNIELIRSLHKEPGPLSQDAKNALASFDESLK